MLKVCNLKKNYGNYEVLKGINFEVPKGSIYGFLGRNGAGKTTTMNIIAGLIDYNNGEIFIGGEKVRKKYKNRNIGYLPQIPEFYGYMSAIEYLRFLGEICEMELKEIKIRTEEVLQMVGLNTVSNKKIGQYSTGMKQRMGIAVALFNKPSLLLLDEPTASLDPEGRLEVLKIIKELKSEGITVFLSTHILSDAERICDYVSIIDDGVTVLSGKLDEIEEKYIQPIFDIEFDSIDNELLDRINNLDYVDKIDIKGTLISIYVNNFEIALTKLLKDICNFGFKVMSMNIRKSNLEDIFMRMVIKNENN